MLHHSNCHSGRQDHFEVCTISVTCTWLVGHSSAARRKRPTSSKRRRRDFRDLGRAWNGWIGIFSCQASSSADVDMDDKAGKGNFKFKIFQASNYVYSGIVEDRIPRLGNSPARIVTTPEKILIGKVCQLLHGSCARFLRCFLWSVGELLDLQLGIHWRLCGRGCGLFSEGIAAWLAWLHHWSRKMAPVPTRL